MKYKKRHFTFSAIITILFSLSLCAFSQVRILFTETWDSGIICDQVLNELSNNNLVVFWLPWQPEGAYLYLNLYDSLGSVIQKDLLVEKYIYYSDPRGKNSIDVCSLMNDTFCTTWISRQKIHLKIYNNNGSVYKSDFVLENTSVLKHKNLSISRLNDGFVISYTEYTDDPDQTKIYFKIYDGEGNPMSDPLLVAESDSSRMFDDPQVIQITKERFLVCWGEIKSEYMLYGQLYQSDGSKINDPFIIGEDVESPNFNPNPCALTNENFVICWNNKISETNWIEYFQLFDSTGTALSGAIQVTQQTGKGYASWYPVISELNGDDFVVCWENNAQLYSRIFDPSGRPKHDEFIVSDEKCTKGFYQRIENFQDGYIVTWIELDDQTIYSSGRSILGKYYYTGDEPVNELRDFSLLSPCDDIHITLLDDIEFKWESALENVLKLPWEIEYTLYLDTNENFDSPEIYTSISDTFYSDVSLNLDQNYYWKIMARNLADDRKWNASPIGSFSTYAVLQEKINNTNPGDEIVIAAGVYNGNLIIKKPITLKPVPGDSVTIIGVSETTPSVRIESDGVTLKDLKIIGNCYHGSEQYSNHGLSISNSDHVHVENCIITGGDALWDGIYWHTVRAGTGISIVNSNHVSITSSNVKGANSKWVADATGGDGGHGFNITRCNNITIDSCSIRGGGGATTLFGGLGGKALILNNSTGIRLIYSNLHAGQSADYGDQDQSGIPALTATDCDSVYIKNSYFQGSSGTKGGYGIKAINISNHFEIVESQVKGAGDYGHGFYAQRTSVYIQKSDIYGGPGIPRDQMPGNGIYAVLYSTIIIDDASIIKGGEGHGLGHTYADSIYSDSTSTVQFIKTSGENPEFIGHQQNYPNPFNLKTTIMFELDSPNFVSLKVYDINGRVVATLLNKSLQTGQYETIFYVDNLASGVYIYRLQTGKKSISKKMILLR